MFVKAKSGKTSKYGIKGKPGKKTKATNEKTTVQKIKTTAEKLRFTKSW